MSRRHASSYRNGRPQARVIWTLVLGHFGSRFEWYQAHTSVGSPMLVRNSDSGRWTVRLVSEERLVLGFGLPVTGAHRFR
jgi:hypothetical protein